MFSERSRITVGTSFDVIFNIFTGLYLIFPDQIKKTIFTAFVNFEEGNYGPLAARRSRSTVRN